METHVFGIWDTKQRAWFASFEGIVIHGPDPAMQAQYRSLIAGHHLGLSAEKFRKRFDIRRMDEFGQPVGMEDA